jgi:hypothetical protein
VTDELPCITLLELLIVDIDRRAHPDFLERESCLQLFCPSLLLAFLKLELPVVLDLSERRISLGAVFCEIQTTFSGDL